MTKGVGAAFSLCCYEEVVVCPSLNKNIFFPSSSAISQLAGLDEWGAGREEGKEEEGGGR